MKTAVVGLGNLGLAMGRRLAARLPGQVLGADLSPERRQVWRTLTGQEALAGAGEIPWWEVDRVFLAVLTEQQTESVLAQMVAGYNRAGANHGVTVFVTTTLTPAFAQGLPGLGADRWHLVELPVTGGEAGALAGKLTAMAAGPLSEADEQFLLRYVAGRIVRFDRLGDPAWAKLLANALIAYQVAALDEVVALAEGRGIAAAQMLETIVHSSAGSYVSTALFDFQASLLQKDWELLEASIGALPVVAAGAVESRFADLRRRLSR